MKTRTSPTWTRILTDRIKAIRDNDAQALYALEDQRKQRTPRRRGGMLLWRAKGSSASVVPVDDLALEWVHGYSGQNMRGSARYSSTGEVVYPAASFGTGARQDARRRAHGPLAKGHGRPCGQITALTTHKDMCATGANDQVLVWSSADVTGVQGSRCSTVAARPWPSSQDGKYLAAASTDDQHTLHIFGLGANQGLVATASTGKDKVLDIAFSKDASTLVYGASSSFGVCTLDGSLLKVKRGLFGGQKAGRFLLRIHFQRRRRGEVRGRHPIRSIYTLDGRKLAEENHSHAGGPCYTMWS